MIPNLVTLSNDTTGQVGIIIHVLTNDVKGRLDIALSQDIQKAWSVTCMRPVVKGHRDIRLVTKPAGVSNADRLGKL